MLLDNPKGNYKFVGGRGMPFSSGAIADSGFAIVHANCSPLIPLADGYGAIERHLHQAGRPLNSICGIELRIPAALTSQGFDQFNRAYLERVAAWGVMIDGMNPIARTNVAPTVTTLAEPSLYGFYYTMPDSGTARPAFVLAGAPEIVTRDDGKREIIAAGDTSADALRCKTIGVLDNLGKLLSEMKLGWKDASAVNLYTVHDLHPLFAGELIPAIGEAAYRGLRWHYARPPVIGLELEMDCYAARTELILTP